IVQASPVVEFGRLEKSLTRPPPTPTTQGRRLLIASYTLSVYAVVTDPAVDVATVIADLEPIPLYRFHQVEILFAVHFAKDDVANFQGCRVYRRDGAQLPGVNLAGHGISTRPKLNGFPLPQLVDVNGCPPHSPIPHTTNSKWVQRINGSKI